MASNNDLYAAVVRQVNGLTSEREAMREQIAAIAAERDALRSLLEMERDAQRALKNILVTDGGANVADLVAERDALRVENERLLEDNKLLTDAADRCEAYERALKTIFERSEYAPSAPEDAGYRLGMIAGLAESAIRGLP